MSDRLSGACRDTGPGCGWLCAPCRARKLAAHVEALANEVERLRGAIKRLELYTRHRRGCSSNLDDLCDCGLPGVVKAVNAALNGAAND